MTIEEKIAYLEEAIKQASKVTYTLGIQHKMAAEQELVLEEELSKCQSTQSFKVT